MRSARVLVVCTLGAGALEAAAGIYLLGFSGPARIGLYLCASGLCTALLAGLLRALIAPAAEGGAGDGNGDGGEPPEPPWWPEFERAFRAHARAARRRSPVAGR